MLRVLKTALIASFACSGWVAAVATGYLAKKRTAMALESLEAAAKAEISAPCEPVLGLFWPTWTCSWRVGLPPFSCQATVGVYRHTDPEKVRVKLAQIGQVPGMLVLEERGIKERQASVVWTPDFK